MRNIFLLSISCFILFTGHSSAQDIPYWKDMNVISVGKQAPRTTFMTYGYLGQAMSGNYEQSQYYMPLNGIWKFHFEEDQQNLKEGLTDYDVETGDWSDIKVPANWETQGLGTPIYLNQPYEFQPRNPQPPAIPDATPVGIYRRDFEIPGQWNGRDIFLHLAGAKSGVYVYINGQEVGYSEDSKDPAEFIINEYIKPGKNSLALKIYRWSTGSYLECQDFWRLSGIERDVFLWSQPKVAVKDFRVISTLDETYTDGIFSLSVDVRNTSSKTENVSVRYELYEGESSRCAGSVKKVNVHANSETTIDFSATIKNVNKWTAETPQLYKVLITVDYINPEIIPFNVGFRKIEIKESEYEAGGRKLNLFYVNGQPIKLKGVNIHELSQHTGHYISPEEMLRNLEIMKQNNVNSIRLSHYPQDRRFYEMCDKYGFYVYDEANIESHGMYYDLKKGGTLGNNPDWLDHHMERIRNMYERNKNYPCVTIWSLGNEAGNGFNFYMAYRWIKERENGFMNRPICYERALWEWNTDMYVPQYPSTRWLNDMGAKGADRPVVPSEYGHAMGNSLGDLYGQWEAIYKYPQLQGGYLWEWMDHSLVETDENGRQYWTYGGDYGTNEPSDGNFCADGIVGPDQVPHPAIAELKYCHQNVGFEAVDAMVGEFRITNRFYFTDLSKYGMRYIILRNGHEIHSEEIDIELAPQESTTMKIPMEDYSDSSPGMEYLINFEVYTKTEEPLLPVGHIIASDQFALPVGTDRLPYTETSVPAWEIAENSGGVCIKSDRVALFFDKDKGTFTDYIVNGISYFDTTDGFGLQPNFWRGPTDNDYGNGMPQRMQVWKNVAVDGRFNVKDISVVEENCNVIIRVEYLLPTGNIYYVDCKLYPSGILNVSAKFDPAYVGADDAELSAEAKEATYSPKSAEETAKTEALEIPRIGMRFRMPVAYDNVRWYGRGPGENYSDRNHGTIAGIYDLTADEMYHAYVRPQENGHRTDTRWLALTSDNGSGNGLLIQAETLVGFNTLRNSVEDFDCENFDVPYQWRNFSRVEIENRDYAAAKNKMRKQTHVNDISPRNFVEVCIDMKQMGVAGYNSWGAKPIPEASIYADKVHEWAFTLIPISGVHEIDEKITKQY